MYISTQVSTATPTRTAVINMEIIGSSPVASASVVVALSEIEANVTDTVATITITNSVAHQDDADHAPNITMIFDKNSRRNGRSETINSKDRKKQKTNKQEYCPCWETHRFAEPYLGEILQDILQATHKTCDETCQHQAARRKICGHPLKRKRDN